MQLQRDFFATEHLAENLGSRSVRGGIATLSGQLVTFLLRLVSTIVLARLLTPEDFGLLAMVLAFTAFLNPFRDVGLSTATIQRTEVNHDQVSNLFWVNTAIGVLLALAFAIAAPIISRFYGKPVLTLTILVFTVKYIFEGLTIQHQALLRRQMRFGAIAWIEIGALSLALLVAVVTAWAGIGHWALIIQQIVFPGAVALGVWLICPWRPGLPRKESGVRSMITYGGQLTVADILISIGSNIDGLLIGRRWGAEALGLYSRAYALILMPINQISGPLSAIALSSLSRLQTEPERYRRFYCQLVTLLAFATTPIILIMMLLSNEIIIILLGEKWVEASTIFTVLAIALLGQPVAATIGLVYLSLGQANRQLRFTMVATPLVVISFFIGLPWGPIGVATAYACSVHLIRFPALWYAFKCAPVKTIDFLKAVWRPVVVSGVMICFVAGAKYNLAAQQPIERLVICCLVGGVTFVSVILLWPKTRREALILLRQIRDLWRRAENVAIRS
jgi:O-antigen/teichoic acid export membrane protein